MRDSATIWGYERDGKVGNWRMLLSDLNFIRSVHGPEGLRVRRPHQLPIFLQRLSLRLSTIFFKYDKILCISCSV
jgi:hypothetical protein